jgi:uncharacterized membrane protein YbhN (UPF0104 family)
LRVPAAALAQEPPPAHPSARARWVIDLVAAPLATLGALLHVVPWTASEWAARRLGPDAPRRGFARLVTSSVFVLASYAASLWWLVRARGVPFMVALATMVVVGALGAASLAYRGRAAAAASTLRIRWMEWRGSRLLTRARRDCVAIGRLVAAVDEAAPSHHPPRMEAS